MGEKIQKQSKNKLGYLRNKVGLIFQACFQEILVYGFLILHLLLKYSHLESTGFACLCVFKIMGYLQEDPCPREISPGCVCQLSYFPSPNQLGFVCVQAQTFELH